MASRDIKDLSPPMQAKYALWDKGMKEVEIDNLIVCTKRTPSEQAALYARGRTITGPIVTWTLNSKHLTGDAFDFVIVWSGKPDWQMTHKDLWNKAVEIGKSLGLSQVVNKKGQVMEFGHLQI